MVIITTNNEQQATQQQTRNNNSNNNCTDNKQQTTNNQRMSSEQVGDKVAIAPASECAGSRQASRASTPPEPETFAQDPPFGQPAISYPTLLPAHRLKSRAEGPDNNSNNHDVSDDDFNNIDHKNNNSNNNTSINSK